MYFMIASSTRLGNNVGNGSYLIVLKPISSFSLYVGSNVVPLCEEPRPNHDDNDESEQYSEHGGEDVYRDECVQLVRIQFEIVSIVTCNVQYRYRR